MIERNNMRLKTTKPTRKQLEEKLAATEMALERAQMALGEAQKTIAILSADKHDWVTLWRI